MYTYKVPSCGTLTALQSSQGGILLSSTSPVTDDATRNMTNTYEILARNAILAYQQSGQPRLWIAVCGGPGCGKTTLATAVAARINEELSRMRLSPGPTTSSPPSITATCLSMDGYHYSRAQLRELGYDIRRRGAPWTFDAERLADDLTAAQEQARMAPGSQSQATLRFPGYSRELSDPVEGLVTLRASDRIVLVEGNYLMLGKLLEPVKNKGHQADTSQCEQTGVRPPKGANALEVLEQELPMEYDGPRSLSDEVSRWRPITDVFDYTWFIHTCDGYDEQRRRLIDRAMRTWNDAKTREWNGRSSLEAATRRVDYNDYKNAILVDCCRKYADIVIASA